MKKKRETGKEPPALQNRPKLSPWLAWFAEEVDELSNDRVRSSEGKPLPYRTADVASRWKIMGYKSTATLQEYLTWVKVADEAYLTAVYQKMANSAPKPQAPKRPRR